MGKAAPGDVVGIAYDADPGVELQPGDGLITRTGRTYVILEARQQLRGIHTGRWHLRCAVADEAPQVGAVVHPLVWHHRG